MVLFMFTPFQIISEVFLAECGILPEGGATEVVGIQHLPDQMSVCAATLEGDIILWNVASQQVSYCLDKIPTSLTLLLLVADLAKAK